MNSHKWKLAIVIVALVVIGTWSACGAQPTPTPPDISLECLHPACSWGWHFDL